MSQTLQILLSAAKAAPIALDNQGRSMFVELAIVTANNDPAKLRRIRCTTAAKGGLNQTNWLMPIFDNPTHDKPLPLIGATVAIGWFGGNPNNGFWMGSIANQTNQPFPKDDIVNDDWRSIPGKSTFLVGQDQIYGVSENQDVAIGKNRSAVIGGNDSQQIGGDNCVRVEGKQVIHVDGSRVIKVEKSSTHQSDLNLEIAAGLKVIIKNGTGAQIQLKETGQILLKSADGMTMAIGRLPLPPLPLSNPDLDCG